MKRISLFSILVLVIALAITPTLIDAKTKTISGTITSVEAGDGSVGTTIIINKGTSSYLKEGKLGWVTKGSEAIAYIKIISAKKSTSVAIVTTHESVYKITSGLSVHFKVEPPPEPKPKPAKKPMPQKLPEPKTAVKPGKYFPMFKGNPAHTGTWATKGVPELTKLLWKFKTGGSINSSPCVLDGVVYFGSRDKNLYAINIKTGGELWRFKTGDNIFSSPSVLDGVVYFGSYDNNLYAVDIKRGKKLWRFKTGDGIRSSPSVLDGVVYFGSLDSNLYAINIKTGQELWRFKTGGGISSSPCVLDGVVYFGSNDGNLYAVE